jgi:hypothetical protein
MLPFFFSFLLFYYSVCIFCRREVILVNQSCGRLWGFFYKKSFRILLPLLFPFNGCRRFGGDVIYHPVNAFHLIDDGIGYLS